MPVSFGSDGYRGVIGHTMTATQVVRIVLGCTEWIKRHHPDKASRAIPVGFDTRFLSRDFAMLALDVLESRGQRCVLSGRCCPSPYLSFATHHLEAPIGIQFTASHNPWNYGGVKLKGHFGGSMLPEDVAEIEQFANAVSESDVDAFHLGRKSAAPLEFNLEKEYAAAIRRAAGWDGEPSREIVVDYLHGTAAGIYREILAQMFSPQSELRMGTDPLFDGDKPEPVEEKLLELSQIVAYDGKDSIGLAFDGDGDRCGVVDNEGNEIFSDKVGVMLARDMSAERPGAQFVVDVKSTGLYRTDPVLAANGAKTDYWKTGHSYIKRRVSELGAVAGFEKSGHFFFNAPHGRGYDDGLVTATAICRMLERNPGKSMADLYRDLPLTFGSPTMSPHCADEEKYDVVERVVARFAGMKRNGETLAGERIESLVTVNGIRVGLSDGSWGLVRASSNKPELVVVVESPVSEERKRAVFHAVDAILRENPEVGAYNQSI